MFLGLFEKWSQSLGYVGQLELVRLGEPLSVAFQLLALEFQICLQGIARISGCRHLTNLCGRVTIKERNLSSKDPGMIEFLTEMLGEFVDGAYIFWTSDSTNM